MQISGKTNQQLIKQSNSKLVFKLIDEYGPISRADLKKITKLSATTVSSLVEDLIRESFVVETGVKKVSTSGRKAVLLKVNPGGGCFAGVEILKSAVIADIYDLTFKCVSRTQAPFAGTDDLERAIIDAISRQAPSVRDGLLGITVGAAGVIKDNKIISSTIMDIKGERDIISAIRAAFKGVRVFLRNNSGLNAYAEKEFGVSRDVKNLISIDIDEGVGAGIVINGHMYEGANGMAGEFGHISIDYNGEKCKCGNYGCIEPKICMPAIIRKAEAALQRQGLTAEDIAAQLESKAVSEVLDNAAKVLSFGINNIINMVDPEVIVIGGGIKAFGDSFLTPLKKHLKSKALSRECAVLYSAIQENPVTLGGAKYAYDMLFK